MAHDGGFQCAAETFHEAIDGGMHTIPDCLVQVDATYLGQTVEELGLNWRPWSVVIV
jgi:hypothetical protein